MTFVAMPLSRIAAHVEGTVEGDASVVIRSVAALDQAEPGDLSFLANPKYASGLASTRASAVLVDGKAARATGSSVALVRVAHPYLAYAQAVTLLWQPTRPEPGVHPGAAVHPRAKVDRTASIMPLAYVGAETVIGPRTVIHPGAAVLERCRIGADCTLYPGATVREDCVLGDRVILHNGASVGADGYGFAQQSSSTEKGPGGVTHVKIPQVGNVILEDDVELGAGTCVDRAALGSTRIGRGTKIDDLVMVGHGCQIGAHSLIVAQSGMAGSAVLGERSVLGARAGVLGHLTVGAGATIMSRSHVTKSVAPGTVVSGNPARPHREQLRREAMLSGYVGERASLMARFCSMIERIERLEKAAKGGKAAKPAKPKRKDAKNKTKASRRSR